MYCLCGFFLVLLFLIYITVFVMGYDHTDRPEPSIPRWRRLTELGADPVKELSLLERDMLDTIVHAHG